MNKIHIVQEEKLHLENHFETVEFSQKEYQKCIRRNGKEICIKDKWFDIQSIKIKGNNIVCKVLIDEDETSLQSTFKKATEQNKKQQQNQFQLFYWLAIVSKNVNDITFSFLKMEKAKKTITHSLILKGHHKELMKPPTSFS